MNSADMPRGKLLNPVLRMAVIAGVEATVRLHIGRGEDINAKDSRGFSPLMLAASKNRASVCALLVEAGADPLLCDPSGRDAFAIALAAGATDVVEVLSAAVSKSEPVSNIASGPEKIGAIVLDDDWEGGCFGAWEPDEEKPPPEGDSSIAEAAVAIHRSISLHVPLDAAEDWADFEALLPNVAAKPKVETDSSDGLRSLLLRAVREGAVPDESVLRVCLIGEEVDEGRERLVRALLAEVGVLPDERKEEGDEPFMVEQSDEEDSEVSVLLSYTDDLDSWRCDPARCYAREMQSRRLLTAEEEVLLGKEMEEGASLASIALAGWRAGLDELENIGKAVASGKVDASSYVLSAGEESAEDEGETVNGDEESFSSRNGLAGEFLSGIAEVSNLRKAGAERSFDLESAISRLRLSPSFLVGLSAIAKSDPEAKSFREAVGRYAKARETMTVCNLRMVYNVVKRYQGLGLPFDDLVQEGNIGLMKAVERYDWRRGFKFSTYATWWIRQNASRAVAMAGRTIRLPVHLNEKLSVLRRAIGTYETRNGTTPSDLALAESVSMPLSMVSMLRARMEEPVPIHRADADDLPFEEILSDEPERWPDAFAARVSLIKSLGQAMSELDERSVEVLTLRYGLDGSDSRTLEETGEYFGVTRERIRQIESMALKKLAHPSRSRSLAYFLYTNPPAFEYLADADKEPRNSKPRKHPRRSADVEAKRKANIETARILLQESESITDASNGDETVSSMSATLNATIDPLIALAFEVGAIVEDRRRNGGAVSIRLPTQRDALSTRLAKELLGAGFKPYPGKVFAK